MKARLVAGKVFAVLAFPPLLLGFLVPLGAIGDKTDKAIAAPFTGIAMALLAALLGLGSFLLLRRASAEPEADRSWFVRCPRMPLLLSGVVLVVSLGVLPFIG